MLIQSILALITIILQNPTATIQQKLDVLRAAQQVAIVAQQFTYTTNSTSTQETYNYQPIISSPNGTLQPIQDSQLIEAITPMQTQIKTYQLNILAYHKFTDKKGVHSEILFVIQDSNGEVIKSGDHTSEATFWMDNNKPHSLNGASQSHLDNYPGIDFTNKSVWVAYGESNTTLNVRFKDQIMQIDIANLQDNYPQ